VKRKTKLIHKLTFVKLKHSQTNFKNNKTIKISKILRGSKREGAPQNKAPLETKTSL